MSYPKKAWVENTPVGGVNGGLFEIVAEAGAVVKSIRIYYRSDKKEICWLSGIIVKLSDGKSGKTGTCDDSAKFEEYLFDVEKLERIEHMTLCGMGTGKWDQVREVKFRTNKNKDFNVGWPQGKQQEYKMDVGSGILIGFMGASGTEIDRIAPIFLKPVKSLYIDNVTYPTLDMNKTDFLQMETLDRGKGLWSGTSYKFQLAGEHQVNTTTTWNRKATLEAGFETTMKAGVLIASAEVKTSLKVGGQFDKGGSNSKTQLLKWNIEKQINGPDDAVEGIATYWSGALNVDYKGTLNIVLQDGEHFSLPTEGTVEQVICSETIQTLKPLAGNPILDEANRELDEDAGQNEVQAEEVQEEEVQEEEVQEEEVQEEEVQEEEIQEEEVQEEEVQEEEVQEEEVQEEEVLEEEVQEDEVQEEEVQEEEVQEDEVQEEI